MGTAWSIPRRVVVGQPPPRAPPHTRSLFGVSLDDLLHLAFHFGGDEGVDEIDGVDVPSGLASLDVVALEGMGGLCVGLMRCSILGGKTWFDLRPRVQTEQLCWGCCLR